MPTTIDNRTRHAPDPASVQRFLDRARDLLGADQVFVEDVDRESYADQMAFDQAPHMPGGAVAPQSVEEVQALMRLANECAAPVWPISRGKNFGYGGSAPVMAGTVVMDLSRMNRILEIDVKSGYCAVEPGVGFFDLYEALEAMGNPLWMSVPGNAWGSVAGNALERGVGPQPYGDHAAQICGMEVVLPTGELVRTGAGAMGNSQTWHLTRNAYGPSWDQMFCQSNFGVVTKLGLWLMPAPEATMSLSLALPDEGDLGKGVERFQQLRLRGLIDHDAAFVSWLGIASFISPRSRWFDGAGPLPEARGAEIRAELGLGWWNAQVNLYGAEAVVKAKAGILQDALKDLSPAPIAVSSWKQGEPFHLSRAGIPGTLDMAMVNWYGGRGGHIGFSPLLPPDGAKVMEQLARTRKRYAEAGLDYYGAFGIGARSVVNVNEILYDRDNPDMAAAVPRLFDALISDAAEMGYCEYRTHIDQMDAVAATFDYNDHAMMRLNQTLKMALDPRGILAPGKQGIWPRRPS